jgi:integrase
MKIKGIHVSNGRYYKVVSLDNRKKKWIPLSRVADGHMALMAALDGIDRAQQVSGMARAIADYLKHHLPTLTPSVSKEQERMFGKIAEVFEQFTVEQVRPKHCLEFLQAFASKPTARQAYKYRMSAFFSWCVVQELCNTNPLREVKVAGPPKQKTRWTDDLFIAMRDKLEPMMQCYHDLSFLLFQRPTEIRLLMQSQRDGNVIKFAPSKTERTTGATVDIAVTPEIDAAWKRAVSLGKLQAGPGGDAPLIQTSDGSTYTRSGIYSAYRRADEALHGKNLVGLNAKAIRPYAARCAEDQGYGLREIQVHMAHAKQDTTEGYIQRHGTPLSNITLRLPSAR